MKPVARWITLVVIVIACVEREHHTEAGPTPPERLPKPFVFEFRTVAVQIDDKPRPIYEDGHMTCTDLNSLKICSRFGEESISFELGNKAEESVSVLWSRAVWIDESGQPHPVSRFPGDERGSDRLVEQGKTHRLSASPSEKTYLIPDPQNAYYFTEPIVPWDLRSGDPDEKRWAMVEARTPLFFAIPVAFGGETHSVRFEYQLFPREKV